MRWLIIVLLLASGFSLFWFFGGSGTPPISSRQLTEPYRGDNVRGVLAVGRVEPRTRVDLKSKANGIIRKLHVDVSEPVRAGQVLAELDREILEARVAEVEGKRLEARGDLDATRGVIERIDVEKTDPELTYSRRNWERAQKLHAKGLVSDDELDLARDRFDKAQYKIRLVDAQLKIARATLASSEGRLKQVEARVGSGFEDAHE